MNARRKIVVVLLIAIVLVGAASCNAGNPPPISEGSPADTSAPPSSSESDTVGTLPDGNGGEVKSPPPDAPALGPAIDMDRDGNPITLPDSIETIISMGPSNTEVLAALGFADKIIATDAYSDNVPGIKPGISIFSMMAADGEQMINMMPDVIFVTGMSMVGGDDPYKVVTDAGICVLYIPSSDSIEGIKDDIRFMAAVLDARDRGDELISDMEREIDRVRAIGETITDKKKVYFEISAAPYMYSFGQHTFLDEIINLIGAVNIFADQISWLSVADEAVLDANPDVILTSVNYIDNPVDEIKSRPGWNEVSAVKNDEVYYISTDSSNRPSHNVVIALLEMAKAVYPDLY